MSVSIGMGESQLTASVALCHTEEGETGQEARENFAEVMFVRDVIEKFLSLSLNEEFVPVVKVFVKE